MRCALTARPCGGSEMQVGIGVGVLVVHEGRVLLGKRLGSHGAGTWSAPGGRLEYGETILECAARELKEETGLVAEVLEAGPYANDLFPEVQTQYVTLFVVARGIRGIPANLEPHKCEGWHWFRWGEWPSPLFKPVQSFLDLGWRPAGL